MLDVTWVAHTLHIQSTTRTLASTLTSHVNGTNYIDSVLLFVPFDYINAASLINQQI